MQILYILPKQDYFGHGRRGRVAHAGGLIAGLVANGCRVTVVSGVGAAAALGAIAGVDVIEIQHRRGRFGAAWSWGTKLLRVVDELLRAEEGIDAVIVRYAMSNAFRFRSLMSTYRLPVWCFEVNSLAYNNLESTPLSIRRLVRSVEWRTLCIADMLYVVSRRLADDIVEVGGNRAQVVVVPNAADRREVLGAAAGSEAAVRFMFLGVFQSYYELELLVRAFLELQRSMPATQLHMFGDGPQFAAVKAARGNATAVVLHGRYDLKALLQSSVLNDSVVLVLPNKARGMSDIGSPIKLYEYMSFGLPILAARVGQAQEVLVQDETACFYEAGRVESCIEAMRRLATDEALRRRLASNVKREFENNHTWDKRAAALLEAFRARGSVKRNG